MSDSSLAESRILVVDDESAVRMVVRRTLERVGYTVLEARDGQEALDVLAVEEVDLVVTDVHMPQLSGMDLLAEIKNLKSHLPVIIVTGKASVQAAVECMKIGAIDYISKPFTIALIEETVAKALAHAESPSRIGETTILIHDYPAFLADYEIQDMLGEGSMGIVYLVEKTVEGRKEKFAIKLYKRDHQDEDERKQIQKRFFQEARAASQAKHPNIVEIIEFGLDENAVVNYIVMEYLPGVPLNHYIDRPDALSYAQKASIIRQVADALSAIHKLSVYHRDIKPANVMVDDDLHVKVTDFGIAKLPDSMLTQQNELMGSPGYMAPESFVSADIDHRADIFSLGIVAYELFLGEHPFGAENSVRTCYRIRNEDPKDPSDIDPDIPPALCKILDTMLKKELAERYDSAVAIVEALDKFIASTKDGDE